MPEGLGEATPPQDPSTERSKAPVVCDTVISMAILEDTDLWLEEGTAAIRAQLVHVAVEGVRAPLVDPEMNGSECRGGAPGCATAA